jgi:hypothetical protein
VVATGVLGVVSVAMGLLPWPRPAWSTSGTGIAATTPIPLWLAVGGTTAVSLIVATRLTGAAAPLRLREPAGLLWLTITVLAAGALVANAIYFAALSTIDFGVPIPIFHWLFTALPAVSAGVVTLRRGRQARLAAAVGTGVVTVPLFALSWALLLNPAAHAGSMGAALLPSILGTLQLTAVLGVGPLAAAAALAAALNQEAAPAAVLGAPTPQPPAATATEPNPAASWALLSGIAGIVLSLLPIGGTEAAFIVGLVLGLTLCLVATVLGVLALRRARARSGANRPQALAATIVGAIGLVLDLPLAVESAADFMGGA